SPSFDSAAISSSFTNQATISSSPLNFPTTTYLDRLFLDLPTNPEIT
ncbi:hypothetical protein LINGRAHAP2_LOCUS19969, partial [Linum grandiflorum]